MGHPAGRQECEKRFQMATRDAGTAVLGTGALLTLELLGWAWLRRR